MSKTDGGREPIDVLYSIEDKLSQLATPNGSIPDEPRFVPSKEETAYDVLGCLKEQGELTSSEIRDLTGRNDVTRPLSNLWKRYQVDREKNDTSANGLYIYRINELGERAFELAEEMGGGSEPEQSKLTGETDPWEDADVTRSCYFAIKAISESSGSPRTTDINDRFLELTGLDEHNSKGPTIGPYLSRLIKETDYIDRTPNIPYRYWVTEQGEELLGDD